MDTDALEGETENGSTVEHGALLSELKRIARISATYLDLNEKAIYCYIFDNQTLVKDILWGNVHDSNALVITAQTVDHKTGEKDITLQAGFGDVVKDGLQAIVFIAVNENKNVLDGSDITYNHVVPFVWNPTLSPSAMSLRFLENIIYPLVEKEKYKYGGDNKRHAGLNDALNGINRVTNILQQIESKSSIRHAYFSVGESLSRVAMYGGPNARRWDIQIPNDVMLEEIKQNVVEWSVEIARILGLYGYVMNSATESAASDTSDNVSDEETETTNTVCSEASSSSYSSLTISITDEIESVMFPVSSDDGIHHRWSISYSSTGNEVPMNVQEEVTFWINYENALNDLFEQLGSTMVENTLSLLEFNKVDVNSIYCFDDAVETASQMITWVENINILMHSLPSSDIKEACSVSDLQDALNNVLKHLSKVKHVKYYSSKKLTEMVLGLTVDVLSSFSVILRGIVSSTPQTNVIISTSKSLDEILTIWKSGVDHLRNSLEVETEAHISLSTTTTLALVGEARDVLRAFYQAIAKHRETAMNVAHLMELKLLFGNLRQDDFGLCNRVSKHDLVQLMAVCDELYMCFLSNINSKLNEMPFVEFHHIMPCINSFFYVLNQIDTVVKESFSSFIRGINRVYGLPHLLSYVNNLSNFGGIILPGAFDNVATLIKAEVQWLETLINGIKDNSGRSLIFVTISKTSNEVFNIAHIQGKLIALKQTIALLEKLVEPETFSNLQHAVGSISKRVEDISSLSSTEYDMVMDPNFIDITTIDIQEMAGDMGQHFYESSEHLVKYVYMDFFGLRPHDITQANVYTNLSVFLVMRCVFEAFKAMSRLRREYDKQNPTAVMQLPEDFLLASHHTTLDHLTHPHTLEGIYKTINNDFLKTSYAVALACVGEHLTVSSLPLTATDLFRTMSQHVKPLTTFKHRHIHDGDDMDYIRGIVNDAIATWQKNALTHWLSNLEHDPINETSLMIRFVDDGGTKLVDPDIDVVKQHLHYSLQATMEVPNDTLKEVTSICSFKYDEINTSINDHLDSIRATIQSILTEIEDHVTHWKDLEANWQSYFENLCDECTDIKRIIKELETRLQSGLVPKIHKVGPVKITIPNDVHKRKLRRLERSILRIICENAAQSAQQLKHELCIIGKTVGINESHQIDTHSSDSASTNTDMNGSYRTSNQFDFETFHVLVQRLVQQRTTPSDMGSLFDTYVEDCLQLEPYFKPLNNLFVTQQKIIHEKIKWETYVTDLVTLEKMCQKSAVDLPPNWVTSKSITELINHLLPSAGGDSDDLLRKVRTSISELPRMYAKIQELFQSKWIKVRDTIDNNRLHHVDVLYILDELGNKSSLLKSHMITIKNIFEKISDAPDDEETVHHNFTVNDDIAAYKDEWDHAAVYLHDYEDILESEPNHKALPIIRNKLEHIKEGLTQYQLVWKTMRKKIDNLEILLNGTTGSFLHDSSFIERVKNELKLIASANTAFEGTVTVKHWLKIQEEFRDSLNCAIRAFEFNKTVNEYIDRINKIYGSLDFMWHYETIPMWITETGERMATTLWALQNNDAILYYIDDSIAVLKTYTNSLYAEQLKGHLIKWITLLTEARTCVEHWNTIETKLKYLTNIFTSPMVQSRLTKECDLLKELLNKHCLVVTSLRYLNDSCQSHESLSKIIDLIIILETRLKAYLDDQRFLCPRYFFLRDNELFHIIGMVSIEELETNISKMFPGVAGLQYEDGLICGMLSKEREVMPLDGKISTSSVEPSTVLLQFEKEMKRSMHSQILRGIEELQTICSKEIFDSAAYWEWLTTYFSQALVVALSVLWTRKMESLTTSNELEGLVSLINSMIKISANRLQNDSTVLQKVEKVSILLIYQLQKTRNLGIVKKNCCGWQRCIRHYINDSGFVELHIGPNVYPYGYEFMGIGPNLILTSLTETCLISISEAMESYLIGNPQGPAGTGKTETVKVLSTLCGYPFWVFNCSEAFDSTSMERAFAGLCLMGAWGIFDEFNRLGEGVLSSIAETIQQIISCRKQITNVITLVGRNIRLNYNVGIFVTLNPGYLSRRNFPLNMRKLCRPIVMEKVDLRQIIHVMLMLNGISDASIIANGLWDVLNCCRICFGEGIYDFGLRCSKAILLYMRILMKITTDDIASNTQYINHILDRSLTSIILPRIPLREQLIFRGILRACLTADINLASNPITQHIEDRDSIFTRSLNSNFGDVIQGNYLKEKALQLFHLIGKYNGILLCGPTGVGKTLCLTATLKIIQEIEDSTFEILRFDPNALAIYDLYGNSNSDAWEDGLFTYFMRTYSESGRKVIIIFDGDMDSSWVESMNSVLDDSKVLTLNNGSRIQLTPNITIVFETDCLDYVTLATMSRCALVRFEMDESRYKHREYIPYFELLEMDTTLLRYDLFRHIHDEKAGLPHFVSSFVNAFGTHMGHLGYQEFINMVDATSRQHGTAMSYKEASDCVLGVSSNSIFDCMLTKLLVQSIPFVLCGSNSADPSSIIYNLVNSLDGWFVVSLFISTGCGNTVLLDILRKHTEIIKNGPHLTMSPITQPNGATKLLLVIHDPEYLSNGVAHRSTFWPLLRQIIELKAFYIHGDGDSWITVHLKNISIALATNHLGLSWIPQRLRRLLPMFNANLCTPVQDTRSTNTTSTVEANLSIPSTGSKGPISDIPMFLNTALIGVYDITETCHLVKKFFGERTNVLVLTGSNMYIRELICQAPSTWNGYKLITLDSSVWSSRMVEIMQNVGLRSEKICLYVDWDILVSQSAEAVCQLKNLVITKDYSTFVQTECEEVPKIEISRSLDVEDQLVFKNNITENLKFIISSRIHNFDRSMIQMGLSLQIPHHSQSLMQQIQDSLMPSDFQYTLSKLYDLFRGLSKGTFRFCDYLIYVKCTRDLIYLHSTANKSEYIHLLTGIEKIEQAKNEVYSMHTMLDSHRTHLLVKNEEAEIKINQIKVLQEEAALKKKEAEILNVSLEEERLILTTQNDEIQAQLADVAPLIEQSHQEVKSINRKSLEELRSMSNPPPIIKHTMETVVMLLTNSTHTQVAWDISRKLIKSSDFIAKIVHFDTKCVSPTTFNIVKSRLEDPSWDINRISKASKAAGPLAKWVESIMKYAEIAMNVAPLLAEVERLRVSNANNEAMLANQSSLIESLENEIVQYQHEYSSLIDSISEVQMEIENTSVRIEKSEALLLDLSDEVRQWKESITLLESDKECITGNGIIESALTILSGTLDNTKRMAFYTLITKSLSSNGISHNYDFPSMVNFERHMLKRNMEYRHCILEDASYVLYALLLEGPFTKVSACDQHIMAILTAGKECGLTLLIKDFVHSPIEVKRAIFNEVRNKIPGNGINILLEISSGDLNRCKQPQTEDDHYINNISELCFILHLELSANNFESFCMDILMQDIDPQLYKAHEDVTVTVNKLKHEMRLKEDTLLDFLVNTTDILDDETSGYFANYKAERDAINHSLRECTVVVDSFKTLTMEHSSFISLVSAVYHIIKRLGTLNSMYLFDVSLLVHAMKSCHSDTNRESKFIKTIFGWIVQTIFAEDAMYWSFELLSLYCNVINECTDIRQLLDDVSHSYSDPTKISRQIEILRLKYLESSDTHILGISTDIFGYFNMIIVVTKGLEDPTDFVETYAKSQGHKLKTLAMTAPSEIKMVESTLQHLFSEGYWVLLKNAHLVPPWFEKFEAQFSHDATGPKMFITWDSTVELDKTVLSRRYRIVYQGADSLQSTLYQLHQMYASFFTNTDKIRTHLMAKSLLLHAIVTCRQSYIPFGWTRSNMFDSNDLLLTLNATVSFAEAFRNDLDAIHNCISEFYNNGLLLNEWRERVYNIYVSKISCDIDCKIMYDILCFTDPDRYPMELPTTEVLDWIKLTPNVTTPSMIGLPDYVDTLLLHLRVTKLRDFTESVSHETGKEKQRTKLTYDFPHNLLNNSDPLLVSALRGQWDETCQHYDKERIISEFNKLQTFLDKKAPVAINLNVFSEPQKLLDILRLIISTSSGVDAEDLELSATLIPTTYTLDQPPTIATCQCYFTKERLIIDHLELVGASYDFSTRHLSVSSNTSTEIRERIYVELHWGKHACCTAQATTVLPIYNSRGLVHQIDSTTIFSELSYTLNFTLDSSDELIYLRNIRLDGTD
ncbi:dynein heavy chain, putative [Babesia ovis]|uniref:Dynein heavy chain, cytoplasmic n=1 Tax=Babesia ovis TaxID=5869 RepID=A0A9W5WUP1_BABOV|nr:dynein heavy chain, putative [Babesia ovis]